MHYPITFSFKILALAPQISVRDAQGQLLWYVKQALFKLKEAVTVFGDEAQTRALFSINADRMLDISARYHIADAQGMALGAIQRHGMRSFWSAHYEVLNHSGSAAFTIREENPWVKVLDAVLGEVPVLGLLTGMFFHPAYLVTRSDGQLALRVTKQRSLLESTFVVDRQSELSDTEEKLALLSILMMILLERSRG